ncbi:inositol monophosphatase family protein [Thermosulfurimonas dismutans]|uniref:Inositol-1-monophosphatase n=1 Tax=Thermosulfurimonas dismutans TaxID=999894 RepID=A0A179D638_9BACT|nr:inositol monophosphatase family protein [Thermosulfurimonas dismutans]OAQ21517.1 Inositol-1-monophosphatase [Thermosulfurimonas dismutans]
MDLEFLRGAAEKAARRAGEFLRENLFRPHRISHKGKIDLVTEADPEAERLILGVLKEETPEIPVLGEELSKIEPQGLYWLVDPLDGTTNYAHGFPWFGVSVALMKDDLPLVGVIYHPMQEEMFSASRGKGAFLNGTPIRVSETEDPEKALLATGFPYNIHEKPEKVTSAFKEFLTKVQGIRRAGAASLDLAYVACGRFDGFWEALLKPWDTAAGILLVEEAGGQVTNYLGEAYTPFQKHLVATNGKIHEFMLKITFKYLPEE